MIYLFDEQYGEKHEKEGSEVRIILQISNVEQREVTVEHLERHELINN